VTAILSARQKVIRGGAPPRQGARDLTMRRLNRSLFDGSLCVFDFEDAMKLFAQQREEAFEGERAIKLFQFRTWMLFSDTDEAKYVRWAGYIAAVKLLEQMDDDFFVGEEGARQRSEGERVLIDLSDKPPQTLRRIETLRRENTAYREMYDHLIGRRCGLLALLYAPPPPVFDQAVKNRIEHMHIVADLIDYRLRYMQHGVGTGTGINPNGANHSHALFFCWWPTHEVKTGRGKTSPNKAVSTRTMRTWWERFEASALFIYLIQKHGFQQLPMDTDTDLFVDHLIRDSNDTAEVLRFLAAYAYLVETFRTAGSDLIYLSVSDSVLRVPVLTAPFSKIELETISQYGDHYLQMTQ
jgi:hypothetical protein